MTLHMTSPPEAATNLRVAAAVIASSPKLVRRALESAAVTAASSRVVVGGGRSSQEVAAELGARWVESIPDLAGDLEPQITHVWLLHDDARPRPDALRALVADIERLDASLVGSKVLNGERPELLESVGGATDVFGVPDVALVAAELDQEQYDVVRDVAYIPGESVLVRRDLLRGLGGPDLYLPLRARAVDLAQRARLAGGRVAVVPSSEVMHDNTCERPVPRWRDLAGQWRALVKVYSPLTLLWLLPTAFVVAAVDALVRTLMGHPGRLVDLGKAILWNIKNLAGTLSARRRTRAVGQVGDEQLFRYQVRGSLVLKALGSDLSDWFRRRRSGGVGTFIDDRRGFWEEPGFGSGVAALVLLAAAGRSLWFGGLPTVGFALGLPDPADATLSAYAGGFNPAGFGSPQPMHPAVGAAAAVQWVTGGDGRRAMWMITAAALFVGFFGVRRVARGIGVGGVGAAVAGLAALIGPATAVAMQEGLWPVLPGLAGAAWATGTALAPWPRTWRGRIGRVGSLMLGGAAAGSFVPLAALVPVALVLLAWMSRAASWRAVAAATAGTAAGLAVLGPWLWWVSAETIVTAGDPSTWRVPWWLAAAAAATAVLAVLAGPERHVVGAGLGGLVLAGGGFLTRAGEIGIGSEPSAVGYVLAAIGGAIVVACVADGADEGASVLGRAGIRLAQLAAAVLFVPAIVMVASGSLGLGDDRFGEALAFTEARSSEAGPGRVLLIGEDLPGQARSVDSVPYRVISGGEVRLAEAWLPAPRAGDQALAAYLESLLVEPQLRPGSRLAEFGIQWVVLTSPSAFDDVFAATLDVKRLPLVDVPFAVFENVEQVTRADAGGWTFTGYGYAGPPVPAVRIAESRSERWGAGSDGWAAIADGGESTISYRVDPTVRALAQVALSVIVLAAAAVVASVGARR